MINWAMWSMILAAVGALLHEVYKYFQHRGRLDRIVWNLDKERARANYMRCMTRTAQMECEVWGRVMSGSVESWLKDHDITVKAKEELKAEVQMGDLNFAPGRAIEVPQTQARAVALDYDRAMAQALEGMGIYTPMVPTEAELRDLKHPVGLFKQVIRRNDFNMEYDGWVVIVRAGEMVDVRRRRR